jgi:hypothetical protein
MAKRDIVESTEHLTFAAADTQDIVIDIAYKACVMFADISAPSSCQITITMVTTDIWTGWITTTPVQLHFGVGRGSGEIGDITVVSTGQAEVFIGVRRNLIIG